jgi:hypothetical protein
VIFCGATGRGPTATGACAAAKFEVYNGDTGIDIVYAGAGNNRSIKVFVGAG